MKSTYNPKTYSPERGKYGEESEIKFENFLKECFPKEKYPNVKVISKPHGLKGPDIFLLINNKTIVFEIERKFKWKKGSFPYNNVFFLERRSLSKNGYQVVFNDINENFIIHSHEIVKKYDLKTEQSTKEVGTYYEYRNIPVSECKEFSVNDIERFRDFVYNVCVSKTSLKGNKMTDTKKSKKSKKSKKTIKLGIEEIRKEINSHPNFKSSVGLYTVIRHYLSKEKNLFKNNKNYSLNFKQLPSIVSSFYDTREVPEEISFKIKSLSYSAQAASVADDILSVYDPCFFRNRERWRVVSKTYDEKEVVVLKISSDSVKKLVDLFLDDKIDLQNYLDGIGKECGIVKDCNNENLLKDKLKFLEDKLKFLKDKLKFLEKEILQMKKDFSNECQTTI